MTIKRKCIKCDKEFQPKNPFQFMCDECLEKNVAELHEAKPVKHEPKKKTGNGLY